MWQAVGYNYDEPLYLPLSEFGVISFFYILQLFFAFANEEKFSENGWMVYNPMAEYRRQVSYWRCDCLVLSCLTAYIEEFLFVHLSYQLFYRGSWEWEKMEVQLEKCKEKKMLEPFKKKKKDVTGRQSLLIEGSYWYRSQYVTVEWAEGGENVPAM